MISVGFCQLQWHTWLVCLRYFIASEGFGLDDTEKEVGITLVGYQTGLFHMEESFLWP